MYHFKKYPMILEDNRGKKWQVYIGYVDRLTHVIVPLGKTKPEQNIILSEVKPVDLFSIIAKMNESLLSVNGWNV